MSAEGIKERMAVVETSLSKITVIVEDISIRQRRLETRLAWYGGGIAALGFSTAMLLKFIH